MSIELNVKSKGELFFPKKFRQKFNIRVGDVFKVTIEGDQIILKKKMKLVDYLDFPPLVEPLTYEEIEQGIREEETNQIELSIKED